MTVANGSRDFTEVSGPFYLHLVFVLTPLAASFFSAREWTPSLTVISNR